MNLAQAAWDQNNAGRLRQLLEEKASYQARGFEWYYWQRQFGWDGEGMDGGASGTGRRMAAGGKSRRRSETARASMNPTG